jgi:mannose-6-phosphate isomerase-like protein (cupin superfamily)
MQTRTYLDGGVTVETLTREASDGRFRAEDERGAVAWLARGREFAYLHAIEFRTAGVRRGFHAHRDHSESLFVFSGRLTLFAGRASGGERIRIDLGPGDLVTFAPDVGHGFISLEPCFALAIGTGSDPIDGAYPVADLES